MNKKLLLAVAIMALGVASVAYAKPQSFNYKGHDYYVVNGNDANADTGSEVCASVGKKCIGYTGLTTDICRRFHPGASVTQSVNGSKTGFYCNGAPQTGLACGSAKDNCQICPQCNVNADCSSPVGGLFREMYVECGDLKPQPGFGQRLSGWFNGLAQPFVRGWGFLRQRLTLITVRKVTVQVTGPNGAITSTSIPTDVRACEFYQVRKKLVTCAAYKAADTFCAIAMQSRFARAALCQENGVIICTNPCHPPEYQVVPRQCAFDGERPRGSQAPPLDFCTTTTTTSAPTGRGAKKPGEICRHGGECTTGNCVGEGPDYGKVYKCSCDPFRLVYGCK